MKTAYHHGDLKNALLDAADEILLSKGLQGFTMRACARLANVSHAAPKHHFGRYARL
jgi:AcrR family transcriptional regulator